MKLLRLKITDPIGFRSLQAGFEHRFSPPIETQEGLHLTPYICAGPNGSGKSNILEALAAIFFQLECKTISFRPVVFEFDSDVNPHGYQEKSGTPDAFELEYIIQAPDSYDPVKSNTLAHVSVTKEVGNEINISFINIKEFKNAPDLSAGMTEDLLPDYILGYSSGENEILSLPFLKMRFIQFDEYEQALKQQLPYAGRPESRLTFLDNDFSQAIILCNLLYNDQYTLKTIRENVDLDELQQFRIIIKQNITIDEQKLFELIADDRESRHFFGSASEEAIQELINDHPALSINEDYSGTKIYHLNLVQLLDGDDKSSNVIPRLKRCATCSYIDDASDVLYLDFLVNDATRDAFRDNFDFGVNQSPIELFQALQVLLALNLYTASEFIKQDLYQSESLYVNETIPVPASDQRITRFKDFWVTKTTVDKPILLKSFSDGEHQLLHTLGLCLLFKNTQSLFLLDEPETHFNPGWRSQFISQLKQCFDGNRGGQHEMLITTHSPFLISDSTPDKMLIFNKDNATKKVTVSSPSYNTLGASINTITVNTFEKNETIGGVAKSLLDDYKNRFESGEDPAALSKEISQRLGDSIEKTLLLHAMLIQEDS